MDIPESKPVDARFHAAEHGDRRLRLFETIISSTPDLVYVFDLNYRFVFVNDALLQMWGRTLEDSLGKRLTEVGYEDWHAELHEREIDQVVATGEPVRGEVPFNHAQLGRRIYDYILVPVFDADGRVEAVAGTTRDISDYRKASEALSEAHVMLEAATAAGGIVAWVWNVREDRMRGNAAFARLFSVDPAAVSEGLPLSVFVDAIHIEDRERVLAAVERTLESGEPYASDYRVHAADGSLRWVSVRGRVEFDEAGQPLKFPGVLVDITDRKEAEAERERLITALGEARNELELRVDERTAELVALNAELESFNYSVSHDLRAPLRGIDGFSQIILEDYQDQLDPSARAYLHRIREGVQRIGRLIDDLMALAHLSRGDLQVQPLDASDVALRVVESLRADDPERKVEVHVQPAVTANCDEGFFRIMLENLLGNAWKFTRERSDARIEFRSERGDSETLFHVIDNGVGFDMSYSDRMFLPFQRLHSPDDFPGTGIGLAIVQRIVQRHGGRVWANSEVGKGATISFSLPSEDSRE